MTLTERAEAVRLAAIRAEESVPGYAKRFPGVGEALIILRDTLELVSQMAQTIECGSSDRNNW